ncbi:MAG: response regulator [Acidobacteriota bacterium]|nr:response regulator [Acidobacteriota bacterium]
MSAPQKRFRVFCCVDDHGETCVRLNALLNESGAASYEVFCARDTQSALLWTMGERFDLYVIDQEFPDRTGLELCTKLRELDTHVPIIFYAGGPDKRVEALGAGAQAYLVKPNIEELAETVMRELGESELAAA